MKCREHVDFKKNTLGQKCNGGFHIAALRENCRKIVENCRKTVENSAGDSKISPLLKKRDFFAFSHFFDKQKPKNMIFVILDDSKKIRNLSTED